MSQIVIFSDCHDNIWNLEKALTAMQAVAPTAVIFCGDFCAPFIVNQIAEAFSVPIHAVLGNNDGDGRMLQALASNYDHFSLHGIYTEMSIADRQIALIHYPEPARRIAQSGQFDLVCYGHDHVKFVEEVGNGLLVNPGEIMGRLGAPTWGLYDCETGAFSHQTVS